MVCAESDTYQDYFMKRMVHQPSLVKELTEPLHRQVLHIESRTYVPTYSSCRQTTIKSSEIYYQVRKRAFLGNKEDKLPKQHAQYQNF